MPHRPERQSGASSSDVSVAPAFYSPPGVHGAPVDPVRGHTVAHIMRPSASSMYTSSPAYYHAAASMVTPLKQTNSWISTNGMRGSMPNLETPRSSDSADRSTVTKHDDSTVATLQTEGSTDEREKREATAALLGFSGQCLKFEKKPESTNSEKDAGSVGTASSSNSATVPLKKRKNLDFLRHNAEPQTEIPTSNNDPCHVSPVSHSSHGSSRVGHTISKEEATPERSQPATARSDSYDSKESPYGRKESAQPLLDSSKISSPTEIAPSSVLHFPSILHTVLSDEAYEGKVLQWLEDGESFKILRWDALRREILPRYFADITDETGKGRGTIDAFLWHLTSWGFEEMKDGSYRHDLFIRGAQKLCSKMRSSGIPSVVSHELKTPKAVSPLREGGMNRSMLQMPPLSTSRPEPENDVSSQANKRARYEGYGRQGTLSWPSRPQEHVPDASGWGHFYSEAAQVGMRHANGQYTNAAFDPRYQHMSHPVTYSPPQVTRSGRGGSMRLPSSSRHAVVGSSAPQRASFPVSNRGKGSRKNMVCRSSIPSTNIVPPATPTTGRNSPVTAVGSTVSAAQHGVAMAVSKRTKRKLPLAQKTVLHSN